MKYPPCSSFLVWFTAGREAALAGDHVPPGEAALPRISGDGGVAAGHDRHRVPGGRQGSHRRRRGGLLLRPQLALQKLGEHGLAGSAAQSVGMT